MQNQFFLHQYWKFMHFSPYMSLARRPSLSSIVASFKDIYRPTKLQDSARP